MQPCDLLPTHLQTHLQFECTRPHTGDTQDVWSPKLSSQGPSLKVVVMATDWHSTFHYPFEGHRGQCCPGCMHVCLCVCVSYWTQSSLWTDFGKCAHTQRRFKDHHPTGPHQAGETLTNTSVCAFPRFRLRSLDVFLFTAARLKGKAGDILDFFLLTKPIKSQINIKYILFTSTVCCQSLM